MLMKISNDSVGNRTRSLPVYRVMLQPIAPTRAPTFHNKNLISLRAKCCEDYHIDGLKDNNKLVSVKHKNILLFDLLAPSFGH